MIKNNKNIVALSGEVNFSGLLKVLLSLAKVRITFFVAITTGIGYLLAKGKLDLFAIVPILFVFLLASAASVLNQLQEIKYDSLMERTKNRPLPSGKVSIFEAISLTIVLFVTSLVLYAFYLSNIVLLLGILNLVWYNIIYTPLKRKSAWAIIPGSLVGAIPPVIGFLAGGGNPADFSIYLIAAYFFIWQIPHFWLLIILYGKEYSSAGYPTLLDKLSERKVAILSLLLVFMLIGFIGIFLNYNLISGTGLVISTLAVSAVVFGYSLKLLSKNIKRTVYRNLFMFINLYVLTIVFIIAIENLTR